MNSDQAIGVSSSCVCSSTWGPSKVIFRTFEGLPQSQRQVSTHSTDYINMREFLAISSGTDHAWEHVSTSGRSYLTFWEVRSGCGDHIFYSKEAGGIGFMWSFCDSHIVGNIGMYHRLGLFWWWFANLSPETIQQWSSLISWSINKG
jgi:hypothetical protein